MTNAHDDTDGGVAGRSARREYLRKREQRLESRQRRSALARIIAGLAGPSKQERRQLSDEKKWATGAAGEELLATTLARRCPDVRLLHDRRMPGTRANIDHIAIAPSGVHVIDTKRYKGRIRVVKPLFGRPKLLIDGRDRTRLLDGLAKQVSAVSATVADLDGDVPVTGCLCFVAPEGLLADVGLPLWRTFEINGHSLYYARRLAKRLNRAGPVSAERAAVLEHELAARFPPA
ncbi:MAG TPA: nuclease-related domain-containing protein [Gemmatimonadales bacterium]|nr:nuclease-related domain-containing protein [Gemmatimonadales bacterium]